MTILDKIVADKKIEVALAKKRLPLNALKKKLSGIHFPIHQLQKTRRLQLIAEIKSKSPSAGLIRAKVDAKKLAKEFEAKGASAISVLTDGKYFGGSAKNLSLARKASVLPILRKDFIVDLYQVYETVSLGADIILLIAGVLSSKIKDFAELSLSLGLQPLIEVHNRQELKNVLKLVRPSEKIIIGVNNRDLKAFTVNLQTGLDLIKLIPKKFIRISESGISGVKDLKQLSAAGFDGALIGEGLAKNKKLFNYFV